ncbi:MAG: phage major capsid protein [Armatimonadetes bacterium]|nr:phage major capsid protein [Armatimonadota bacterium]
MAAISEKIKALADALKAKAGELDKLVNKESHSAEDVSAMKALRDEVNGLRGQLTREADVAQVRQELAGLEQFIETPAALPGGHPGPGGVTFLGMKPAGETILDGSGKRVEVLQIGEGLMEAKTLQALRQADCNPTFHKYLRLPFGALTNLEQKTLQEGADTSGGYTVPEEWLARILAKEPTPTRLAGRVTPLTTVRDSLAIPKVNYTTDDLYSSGMRVTWTGEVPSSATAARVTDPVFVQINAAGTISAKVPASPQACADAPAALAALPSPDAGNLSLGYIAIESNAGDWTANTDDITDGSDLTTAAFNDSAETSLGAAKAFELVSEADGDVDINITESGAKSFYLVLVLPNGKLAPSGAITFT